MPYCESQMLEGNEAGLPRTQHTFLMSASKFFGLPAIAKVMNIGTARYMLNLNTCLGSAASQC